ncbi:hypothetical protein [Enterococcus sp. DIV0800]|uniref:hypothetical protein n=1 Tax=unclassified Enterococcus TaxID=2608891 RepID=UPI003D2F9E24
MANKTEFHIKNGEREIEVIGEFTEAQIKSMVKMIFTDPNAKKKTVSKPVPIDQTTEKKPAFNILQKDVQGVSGIVKRAPAMTTTIGENESFKELFEKTELSNTEERAGTARMAEDAPRMGEEVKIKVHCKSCGREAVQLGRFGNTYVKCMRCGNPLWLQPAVKDSWGAKDEDGNTYFARYIYKS